MAAEFCGPQATDLHACDAASMCETPTQQPWKANSHTSQEMGHGKPSNTARSIRNTQHARRTQSNAYHGFEPVDQRGPQRILCAAVAQLAVLARTPLQAGIATHKT